MSIRRKAQLGQHKSPAFSRFGTSKIRDNKEILYKQPIVFLDDTDDFLNEVEQEIEDILKKDG